MVPVAESKDQKIWRSDVKGQERKSVSVPNELGRENSPFCLFGLSAHTANGA
jgi:hypothetical protein